MSDSNDRQLLHLVIGGELKDIGPDATEFKDLSKVDFVGAKVTGKHDGGFKTFDGHIMLDGKMLKAVAVNIDMASTWSDSRCASCRMRSVPNG